MVALLEEDIKASNILVVDDEAINLIAISDQLKIGGYNNIKQISDPFKAVKAYQSTEFDMVLLDIDNA